MIPASRPGHTTERPGLRQPPQPVRVAWPLTFVPTLPAARSPLRTNSLLRRALFLSCGGGSCLSSSCPDEYLESPDYLQGTSWVVCSGPSAAANAARRRGRCCFWRREARDEVSALPIDTILQERKRQRGNPARAASFHSLRPVPSLQPKILPAGLYGGGSIPAARLPIRSVGMRSILPIRCYRVGTAHAGRPWRPAFSARSRRQIKRAPASRAQRTSQ